MTRKTKRLLAKIVLSINLSIVFGLCSSFMVYVFIQCWPAGLGMLLVPLFIASTAWAAGIFNE